MPRKARPWLRKGQGMNGTFHVHVNGQLHNLKVPGPDTPANRALAEDAYQRLLADLAAEIAPKNVAPARTVSALLPEYLSRCEGEVAGGRMSRRTLGEYRRLLGEFAGAHGTQGIKDITGAQVERWADQPRWSSSSRFQACGVVLTFLRWAGHSPKVRRPPMESRGASCLVSPEDLARVLGWLAGRRCGGLPDLVRVLWHTGARPSEVLGLSAAAVDWDHTCVRLTRHKTRRKTGRDRVIRLNPDAVAVLRTAATRHPDGPLFRNSAGRAFTPQVIAYHLRAAGKALGLTLMAYGFRHSFATRALTAGVPEVVVAALLGHKGTAMLSHHYSHVSEQARVLQDAVDRLAG